MRQILTSSLAAEADRRKVETAERKRIHKEQKRALDALNAREESIHERVAALTRAMERKTATDERVAALTEGMTQKTVVNPTLQTGANSRQTGRVDSNEMCGNFLRGSCTRLDCTRAHLSLPPGFQAIPRGQNKRPRDNGYTNNRRAGMCYHFGTPKGCWRGSKCRYEHDRKTSVKPKCGDCGAPHQTGSVYCYQRARHRADQRADAALRNSSVPAIMPPPRTMVCQLCKGSHVVLQCPTYLALTKNE
jgi:hypothetical protein